MNNYDLAVQIAKKVNEIGGTAYFVGGYVRDKLLGIPNKDIDIEIHNINPEVLENILKELGEVQSRTVGNNFGIYNIDGYDLDISLPRKEKATGKGHKDFEIVVDPFLSLEESAKRRDFTINALMKNVLTGEIKDYFGGLDDLNNGVIRHIDDKTFIEDSLRVLRLGYSAINLLADNTGTEWYKTEEEAKAAMDKLKGKDNKDIERDIERD